MHAALLSGQAVGDQDAHGGPTDGTPDDPSPRGALKSWSRRAPAETGDSTMRRLWRSVWLVILPVSVLLMAGGCGLLGNRVQVPPGVKVGHLAFADGTLTIDPSTVQAGDAYFAIDEGARAVGPEFITGFSDDTSLPPLTDEDIARLARGDGQGFSRISGMYGDDNIIWLSGLLPGKYAFVIDRSTQARPNAPPVMAVLTVVP